MKSNWHRTPNVLVDKLMGVVLSPPAACVVLTVWRLTNGIRERHEASIPTEKFMRVTKTNRKKTAYQHVNEAVKTGLINVKKEQGKVNVYSINKDCPLWYNAEVVAEIVPSTKSATGVDNSTHVEAESATDSAESRGENSHTYKDNLIKDRSKDIETEEQDETTNEKPLVDNKPKVNSETQKANFLIDFWNDNHGKGVSANVNPAVWVSTVKARLRKFNEEQIKIAMLSVINSHWHQQNNQVVIKNAIDSDKRCDQAISKSTQIAVAKIVDRSMDKLAVNNQWEGHNGSNIIAANTTVEDILGD